MDYYCDVCGKTIKSKSKHLQCLTHNEFEKCIRMKHTIENPDFSFIDSIFNDYITNHNKNFDINLVEYDFNLVFDKEFNPYIKSEFQYNTTISHLKRFSLNWVEYFSERGHKFFHIYKMNFQTFSNKKYMTFECYIEQPMQMVEMNLNMIIAENPNLRNALDRSINHPLIRKNSNLPFNQTNSYFEKILFYRL